MTYSLEFGVVISEGCTETRISYVDIHSVGMNGAGFVAIAAIV